MRRLPTASSPRTQPEAPHGPGPPLSSRSCLSPTRTSTRCARSGSRVVPRRLRPWARCRPASVRDKRPDRRPRRLPASAHHPPSVFTRRRGSRPLGRPRRSGASGRSHLPMPWSPVWPGTSSSTEPGGMGCCCTGRMASRCAVSDSARRWRKPPDEGRAAHGEISRRAAHLRQHAPVRWRLGGGDGGLPGPLAGRGPPYYVFLMPQDHDRARLTVQAAFEILDAVFDVIPATATGPRQPL